MNTILTLSRYLSKPLAKGVASPASLPRVCLQAFTAGRGSFFSTLPKEEYYDGHLVADHLEYVDDMINKTLEIEENMRELKTLNVQKYNDLSVQKEGILNQVTDFQKDLRKVLEENSNGFAVDGPDGTADGFLEGENLEIDQIIKVASFYEDAGEINDRRAKFLEESSKVLAVDGPDGTADGFLEGEKLEIDEIIEFASLHEDTDKINDQHGVETEIRKERARDPEHDW